MYSPPPPNTIIFPNCKIYYGTGLVDYAGYNDPQNNYYFTFPINFHDIFKTGTASGYEHIEVIIKNNSVEINVLNLWYYPSIQLKETVIIFIKLGDNSGIYNPLILFGSMGVNLFPWNMVPAPNDPTWGVKLELNSLDSFPNFEQWMNDNDEQSITSEVEICILNIP